MNPYRTAAAPCLAALLAGCGPSKETVDPVAGNVSGKPVKSSPVQISVAEKNSDRDPVREFLDWEKARAQGTLDAYAAFMDDYPDGPLAEEAARRSRILELEPINLSIEVAAPEGQFMVSAPPSNGSIAPSGAMQEMPEGTTMTLTFSTTVDGEEVTETIETTYDSAIFRAMVFRNDDGICLRRTNLSGTVSYCDGEEPPPPDPSNVRGLMAYAWLVVRLDI